MSIILIGYRCTGKTSVARQLGSRLMLPVIDSDSVIEERTGKNVAEIFAQCGENVFRDIEESVITDVLASGETFVLSCGGGVILRQTNRQRLRSAGKVYWLTATPETIIERMRADTQSASLRPNLTVLTPLEEIKTLLTQRQPLYAETAHETIETDHFTTDEIVDRMCRNEEVLTPTKGA
ncbi:MAG: shikimate kinase [Planctomycetaceae bacterium]|jgi:shikimate kinase|nr:shikimate kinase [Planctomycetaceae bacterium]